MQTHTAQTFTITSPELTAEISMAGAELVRLRDRDGRDLLWDGDPAFWTGRSPLLFPVVGRLKGDQVTVDGKTYPMRQHGFARSMAFELVSHEAGLCRLRLRSNEETRGHYPFEFSFEATYRLSGATLEMSLSVQNPGSTALPVSVGFHPAFRWPLPYGAARLDHQIVFEKPEPGPLRGVVEGLMANRTLPTPVRGRTLELSEELFARDALVFLEPESRSVRFGPPGGPSLRVDYPGMPQLGIWTKPQAGYLCIEPWHGYASPEDFDGELKDKPGIVSVPPGGRETFAMTVTLDPAE